MQVGGDIVRLSASKQREDVKLPRRRIVLPPTDRRNLGTRKLLQLTSHTFVRDGGGDRGIVLPTSATLPCLYTAVVAAMCV